MEIVWPSIIVFDIEDIKLPQDTNTGDFIQNLRIYSAYSWLNGKKNCWERKNLQSDIGKKIERQSIKLWFVSIGFTVLTIVTGVSFDSPNIDIWLPMICGGWGLLGFSGICNAPVHFSGAGMDWGGNETKLNEKVKGKRVWFRMQRWSTTETPSFGQTNNFVGVHTIL